MDGLSKSAVNRLGARLRSADVPSAEDVEIYIGWSAGYSGALEDVEAEVVGQAKQVGDFEIASRTKQISSVIAKLKRMNRSNLARIEDIVGCRVIVPTLLDQDRLAIRCARLNVTRNPRDYRRDSQHGYRAVHFTIRSSTGLLVEVQVRTELQHTWARLTERMPAIVDPALKYGGGPNRERRFLDLLSFLGYHLDLERAHHTAQLDFVVRFGDYVGTHIPTSVDKGRQADLFEQLDSRGAELASKLEEFAALCDTLASEGRTER
ncbi:MAG: RelA/SpoT domain-containing protein [Chloroflexota bacterium]|nr:RelA/SpoT domain-containing protein [Chloroflexota bacterium]